MPTPTVSVPAQNGPTFVIPQDQYQSYPAEALPDADRSTHPHLFAAPPEIELSPEEQQYDHTIQDRASSQAARAWATQRLDINSLHHANNHAAEAATHLQNMQALNAPQSIRDSSLTQLQVALENQYHAWQRAYLNSTRAEQSLLSRPSTSRAETTLRHAIRMGIEYLEAEDRLASSHPDHEPAGPESVTLQARDLSLQRYQIAVVRANAAIGMPPTNIPTVSFTGERRPSRRESRSMRRAAQAAAAAAGVGPGVHGGNEPLPVLGHGPNVRPLAAGIIAAFVPHLWSAFKFGIFIYAFTRMDDSWERYALVSLVGLCIFLYNIGILPSIWRVVEDHIHQVLPMDPVPENVQVGAPAQPDGADNSANTQTTGNDTASQARFVARRRSREPTPEEYAARVTREARDRAHANRSPLHNMLRTIEHDLLLFVVSIVPGVAERHIAARNSETRARERQREEVAGEEQERRDETNQAGVERREAAVGVAAGDGPRQEREGNRFGEEQRLGGNAVPPRPAVVEDDLFGGVD